MEGVLLRDGTRLDADAVVSAVPAWALLKIIPDLLVDTEAYFQPLKQLSYSPILSIHLWLDQKITDALFTGLLDTHIQWLFNRSRIHREAKTKEGYVSLVISGAHDFMDWPDAKILSLALEELRRLFPRAKEAVLLRSLVIREAQATLSPRVGGEALRPGHESPIKNLWVAGDWTKTGLPATIESACVSGHRCAEMILSHRVGRSCGGGAGQCLISIPLLKKSASSSLRKLFRSRPISRALLHTRRFTARPARIPKPIGPDRPRHCSLGFRPGKKS